MFTPLGMDSMDNLDMEMLILGNDGLKGMQLSKFVLITVVNLQKLQSA